MIRARFVIFQHADEINGRAFRALVEPLEKSVLAVCAFIAPDDRTGYARHAPITRRFFAITFHFKLLEEG